MYGDKHLNKVIFLPFYLVVLFSTKMLILLLQIRFIYRMDRACFNGSMLFDIGIHGQYPREILDYCKEKTWRISNRTRQISLPCHRPGSIWKIWQVHCIVNDVYIPVSQTSCQQHLFHFLIKGVHSRPLHVVMIRSNVSTITVFTWTLSSVFWNDYYEANNFKHVLIYASE